MSLRQQLTDRCTQLRSDIAQGCQDLAALERQMQALRTRIVGGQGALEVLEEELAKAAPTNGVAPDRVVRKEVVTEY